MKKYETPEDRAREKMVMKHVAHAMGWKCRQVETMSPYDGELADCRYDPPRVMALIEIKCRFVTRLQYPTLIISAKKIDRGRLLAKQRRLDYMIACRWNDCIGWTRIGMTEVLQRAPIARYDRNDPRDKETGYAMPVERFNVLEAVHELDEVSP